jgi:hypothetical protein
MKWIKKLWRRLFSRPQIIPNSWLWDDRDKVPVAKQDLRALERLILELADVGFESEDKSVVIMGCAICKRRRAEMHTPECRVGAAIHFIGEKMEEKPIGKPKPSSGSGWSACRG